jgi:hypothetical protein
MKQMKKKSKNFIHCQKVRRRSESEDKDMKAESLRTKAGIFVARSASFECPLCRSPAHIDCFSRLVYSLSRYLSRAEKNTQLTHFHAPVILTKE